VERRQPWLYAVNEKFLEEFNQAEAATILENLTIKVSLSMLMSPDEPEDFLQHYFFTVNYIDYDEDGNFSTNEVAWAEVVVMDKDASCELDLWTMCDAESGDMAQAYIAVYDSDEYLLDPFEDYLDSPVCYLAEFIVEEKFKDVRDSILNWVIKYMLKYSPIIFTLPVPTEKNGHSITRDWDQEKMARLRMFFTNQGFLPLRDTDYMYHLHDYSEDA